MVWVMTSLPIVEVRPDSECGTDSIDSIRGGHARHGSFGPKSMAFRRAAPGKGALSN